MTVRAEDTTFKLAFWLQDSDEPDMEWCNIVFQAERWEGEPYNAEPHMHSEIAWLRMGELPDNITPSVRKMLEAIEKEELYGELHIEK